MGIFLRQDENRSELQSKIIADLQEKSRTTALQDTDPETSTYLEHQHATRPAGIVIGVLLVVLVAVVVYTASQR